MYSYIAMLSQWRNVIDIYLVFPLYNYFAQNILILSYHHRYITQRAYCSHIFGSINIEPGSILTFILQISHFELWDKLCSLGCFRKTLFQTKDKATPSRTPLGYIYVTANMDNQLV